MRSERNRPSFILMSLGLAIFAARTLTAAPGKTRPGLSLRVTRMQAPKLDDAVLAKAYRFESAGWIYIHLEGAPHDIGYQHVRRRSPLT